MPMIVGLVELLELADVEVMLGDGGSEASRGEDNPRAQKEGRERENKWVTQWVSRGRDAPKGSVELVVVVSGHRCRRERQVSGKAWRG